MVHSRVQMTWSPYVRSYLAVSAAIRPFVRRVKAISACTMSCNGLCGVCMLPWFVFDAALSLFLLVFLTTRTHAYLVTHIRMGGRATCPNEGGLKILGSIYVRLCVWPEDVSALPCAVQPRFACCGRREGSFALTERRREEDMLYRATHILLYLFRMFTRFCCSPFGPSTCAEEESCTMRQKRGTSRQ